MIELDIQLSADGQAVVIHNETLDETTSGQGSVSAQTVEQLAELDAGSWFSSTYAGQRVPLLADVLQWMAGRKGIELLLEFKGEWDAAPVSRVVAELESSGMAKRTVVQSFSATTVQTLADTAPDIPRGLLVATPSSDLLAQCATLKADQCNPAGMMLLATPGVIKQIQEAGMRTMVWTANEPEQWAALVELGVDGIITDRPDALRGYLSASD